MDINHLAHSWCRRIYDTTNPAADAATCMGQPAADTNPLNEFP